MTPGSLRAPCCALTSCYSTRAGSPQWPYGNYFHNITGLNDYDNYLNTNAPADFGYYAPYLNQPAVRTALHVGNATFPSAPSVCERHLLAEDRRWYLPSAESTLTQPAGTSAPGHESTFGLTASPQQTRACIPP